MDLELASRIGGGISSVGVALFVIFVVGLLAFPVVKQCSSPSSICKFVSQAPENFKAIVGPVFLAVSLALIASGILVLRLSRMIIGKKTKADG